MKNEKRKLLARIIFILSGVAATTWFLIRVIPKPSRASYPCQRAAFPIASTFVLWLIGQVGIITSVIKGVRAYSRRQFVVSVVLFVVVAGAVYMLPSNSSGPKALTGLSDFVPTDGPNNPMGVAQGINPGRVTWVWDSSVTKWDSTAYDWFYPHNLNYYGVRMMFDSALKDLTGTTNTNVAWDSLFAYTNRKRGRKDTTYAAGEKIAILINVEISNDRGMHTTAQTINAVLHSLVHVKQIPEERITLYQICTAVDFGINYAIDTLLVLYPNIGLEDNYTYKNGPDSSTIIEWSEPLVLEGPGGNTTFVPKAPSYADYIINIAATKGHDLAGITACSKNMFGSLIAYTTGPRKNFPIAAGLHPYVAVHDYTWYEFWSGRPMGVYNPLVDLLGHEHLGKKTVLFMTDALFTGKKQNGDGAIPNKWSIPPFNNDYPSSLFLSQDPVALESVLLDLLNAEPHMTYVTGNVDNYLHEAAQADNPPSGTFYDPENDGSGLPSQGVHEHWNNVNDKHYDSIDLHFIEMKSVSSSVIEKKAVTNVNLWPNPADNILQLTSDNQLDHIVIIDNNGKKVFARGLSSGSCNSTLDISFLEPGCYHLVVYAKHVRSSITFIKQ
jgi:hypothetical protein